MHQDKKVGLALGVLLVGIVAAFFYRNDRSAEPQAPKLENPQSLDDRIAERPFSPYLTGVEGEDVARNVSHGGETRRTPDERSSTLGEPVPFGQESRRPADVPDPIPSVGHGLDRSGSRIPEHNRDWTPLPIEKVTRPSVSEKAHEPEVRGELLHEVRSGETLSGIAAKYLGSSNRFHDIYQANRDQLKSPNDVRIGMKLRIPKKGARTATNRTESKPAAPSRGAASLSDPDTGSSNARTSGRHSSVPTRSISSSPQEEMFPEDDLPPVEPESDAFGDDGRSGHLFRPSRRSPLSPSTTEPRLNERITTPASSGKTLSQRLPEDLPELDEALSETKSRPRASASDRAIFDREPAGASSAGVPSVKAPPSKRPAETSSEPAPGRYLVLRGDTLERIAQRLFGDRTAATRIFEANRDVLRSVDDVREGMSLKIPR